jgi:hypothetical protein
MSWTGHALGTLLGIPTGKATHLAELIKLAKSIETLSINQQAIVTHVTAMQRRQEVYGNLIRGYFEATATIAIEQDLKSSVRHMQVIQQLTLAKYTNVLMSASLHKTSPYALSQKELNFIAADMQRQHGLQLSTNIKDVIATAVVINGELHLLFEVPIIEENNLFNFYRVKPMPLFTNNRTLVPIIDADYIAVSKSGSQFVKLTADQFTRCVTAPSTCQVSSPISPITTGALCVITTYMKQKLTCPVEETLMPRTAEIHVSGNKILFSVPEPLLLYVKCSQHKQSDKFSDEPITISGMGEAAFRQGCTITLTDGRHFRTPLSEKSVKLPDLAIFELLKTFPQPEKVTIHRIAKEENLPELSLTDVQLPTHAQLAAEAFHPIRSIPFLMRLTCVFVIITAIAVCLYCLRHRLKRYVSCITCGKFCGEPKKQQINTETMLNHLTAEFEKLRMQAATNMEKWKTGSSQFVSNLSRSKSSPDLTGADTFKMKIDSEDWLPPPPSPTVQRVPGTNIQFTYTPVTPKPILKTVHFQPTTKL